MRVGPITIGPGPEQLDLPELFYCICTKVCDCACPEPEKGVACLSNECPVHNWDPYPHPDRRAAEHFAAVPRS